MTTPSSGPTLGEGASRPGVHAVSRGREVVDLLRATAAGDERAFEQLYDLTAARVHGLVLRVLRDPAQSEEVTQEVFLDIWKTADQIDVERGSPMGWILTLAHRRAVDRVRSAEAARRRDHLDVVRDPRRVRDETVEQAHANLDGDRVRAALGSLTELQREAIRLAYFEGHTHTQVADLLDIPLGTAKSRIRDALLRLRDVLGEGT
ncbi:MAG: ECF RNA polymerase sigma factor SigK [Dermatophilaceae bacterium]|nr:ECF RNA polymerase sigma factor SigK [Intrasporangiaceae bacterium]